MLIHTRLIAHASELGSRHFKAVGEHQLVVSTGACVAAGSLGSGAGFLEKTSVAVAVGGLRFSVYAAWPKSCCF